MKRRNEEMNEKRVRVLTLLRLIEEAYDDANLYGMEWAFEEIRDILGASINQRGGDSQ